MRNLKRVLALALALVMMLGMMITASAATYTDAAAIDAQYTEAADVMTGMGVVWGQGNNMYAPKAILTRAEAAALIYRVITGDVTDAQKVNYNYSTFDDVAANAWYTGYITYAANGDYIKGDGTGNFNPNDTVTGVQVMAIMLRAIGYGQKGEYEGAAWMDNVLTDAKELGITGNIATSTLIAPASRELVVQLIFNALTNPYMVTYTPALGYLPVTYTASVAGLPVGGTITLGEKVFGLTNDTGIVVGNQATGETVSKIAYTTAGASYAYADAKNFNTATGLEMFGHAAKVWYDARTLNSVKGATVYAIYDKATKAETVVATDANLGSTGKLGAAVKAAGFSYLTTDAYWSGSYAQLSATRLAASAAGAAASNVYTVVSNNALGTVDVVIKVDAEIAKISMIDTTAKVHTLTLSNSTYGIGGVIPTVSVTAGSTTNLGAVVIANKINGTNALNTNLPYYDLDAVNQTKTGTVVGYDAATGKVVMADGSVIEKSPLYNVVKSGIVQNTPNTNAAWVLTLDNNGKYLGASLYNDNSFIYGTYADYASAGTNTGTVNYYMTGVTLDGQIVTKDITKHLGIPANAPDNYTALSVVKKGWNVNSIVPGTHTGYAVDSNGMLTGATNVAGVMQMYSNRTITAANVKAGYQVDPSNTTFLTNATKFIVVSGTGTDTLKVTTYNGIAELLGAADSVTINANNVYYTRSAYIYNNVAGQTYHLDTIILGADDLSYVTTSDVYYAHTVKTGLTDTKSGAVQYELYKDGVAGMYYITGTAPAADTFYTLTEAGKTANGETVYTVASTVTGTRSGSYAYVGATNNLDTALINNVLTTVTTAKIVNLTPAAQGYALGTIAELNNAVSVGYTVTVDCVVTQAGAAVIYVTGCSK